MDGKGNSIWQMISVEVEGPFTKTPMGNQYVVILTDLCSKWVEIKALSEKTATGVASFVMSIFARMGFAECKFFNLDATFEKEVRQAIHTQGAPFVRNVAKFRAVLDRIWNEELGVTLDERAATAASTDDSDVGTEVTVLETGEILLLQGLMQRQPDPRGPHTDRFLRWVGSNLDTWDTDLDGYLFKLRMGGGGGELPDTNNPDSETSAAEVNFASPFDVIYAGRTSLAPRPPAVRGRGRPRGRGRHRVVVPPVNRQPVVLIEGRRPRGRPRKLCKPVHYDLVPIVDPVPVDPVAEAVALLHDEGGAAVGELGSNASIAPRRKYGLRTTLRASVKTNIVQRMLKRSANKRSGMENAPNIYKKPRAISSYSDSNDEEEATESILGLDQKGEDEMWRHPNFKRKRGRPRKNFLNVNPRIQQLKLMQHMGLQSVKNLATKRLGQLGIRKVGRPMGSRKVTTIGGNKVMVIRKKLVTAAVRPKPDGTGVGDAGAEVDQAVADAVEGVMMGEDGEDESKLAEDELEMDEEEEDGDTVDELEDEDDLEADENEEEEEESDGVKVSCPACPGILLHEKELAVHASFHRKESKLLHCLYCTHITAIWEHMQEHLVGHIENDTAPGAASMLKKLRGSRAAAQASRKLRRKELAGMVALRCSQCIYVRMATLVEQRVHKSCHREDSRLLRCPHCPHVAGTWSQMQEHLGVHPDLVPLEAYETKIEEKTCGRCHRVFDTTEMVQQHQLVYHAREKSFMCDTCGKTFKERKSIQRHQELHANVVYQCEECSYKTRIQRDYLDHQRIHKGLGFNCTLCEKVFSRQSQLGLHMDSHRKDKGVVICDQCGHQANGMAALRHHIRNMHGIPQSWPCSLCSYIGKTKSNLKGHTDRIHNKRFKCPHCDYATLTEGTLIRHVDIFHNEGGRQYPCSHCPYRAREPKCLTEHIRVLHNPLAQKFPCEFCGIEFKTKSMLRDHMPQHTGQRFVCQLCGYVAKYRSILYRHVKKRHPGRTLADLMQNTEPLVTQTPDGKPILPPKSRAPRRKFSELQRQREVAAAIDGDGSGLEIDIANMQESEGGVGMIDEEQPGEEEEQQHMEMDGIGDEEEESTVTYITQAQADMLAQATQEGMTDADGNMYISASDALSIGHNSIMLDADFLRANAGGAISLPNNMCLQIIQEDQDGEVTMQVIPTHGGNMVTGNGTVGGEGTGHEGVELLLLAGDGNSDEVMHEGYDQEQHCIVMV